MQITADVEVTAEFGSYGGDCADYKGNCVPLIVVSLTGVSSANLATSCMAAGKVCVVTVQCRSCKVISGAKVEYQLSEEWSYADFIRITVQADSSIPNESSIVQQNVAPSEGRVFRGTEPSKMYFELISSVFKSESQQWTNELTGYHVSTLRASDIGSSIDISEIPAVFGLKLVVFLDLSSSGLSTARRLKQNALLLLSSALGAFFGLMDTFGYFMEKFEEKWLDYSDKRRRKREFTARLQQLKGLFPTFNKARPRAKFNPVSEECYTSATSTLASKKTARSARILPLSDKEFVEMCNIDSDDYMPWLPKTPSAGRSLMPTQP